MMQFFIHPKAAHRYPLEFIVITKLWNTFKSKECIHLAKVRDL